MHGTANLDTEPAHVQLREDESIPIRRSASPALVRFGLHYLEMLAVMAVGMMLLGSAMAMGATALGYGWDKLEADAPALILTGMALSMTAPMVWWMRRRGHFWPATRAMAVSMIAPTAVAIALLISGALDDLDALLGIQHLAMFPAMAAAMLLHRHEYIHSSPDA